MPKEKQSLFMLCKFENSCLFNTKTSVFFFNCYKQTFIPRGWPGPTSFFIYYQKYPYSLSLLSLTHPHTPTSTQRITHSHSLSLPSESWLGRFKWQVQGRLSSAWAGSYWGQQRLAWVGPTTSHLVKHHRSRNVRGCLVPQLK